ncbi:alpha/beta fold hydrolase [Comamonas sp. Y33R10-2]|uniref:alpha/beta fold hydrolase n=1 Tax=Comamonas sp. Y33R10-2 TaxID=2853257 RepID=UPI001C5C98D0|nr:alpha/beta hydrolase [Comamonas sp. Y33R10-2]QXZ10564.1 alpha/beta fold hydrolase [Comamonas sp. Y33R10-2]
MRLTPENTSRFVQAGPVKIHYHEAGEGPVLLCIHGGAPGAFGWSNFGRNLEALSQNFRTLIVDLPGYGKSDKPVIEGPRTGAYAQCFKDMLQALGVEKAHILGMATGGSVAIKMALEYPGVVDKLVLINCPGGLSLFQQKAVPATHSYYQGEGPSMERMRASMERLVFDKRCITDDMVRERYEASIAPEFMNQAPEGKGGKPGETLEVLWPELHRIEAQTLIIWGRDNPTLNFDNAIFMLNRIKNSRVHIHSQCGLLVPIEKPEEFNNEVYGFLQLK